MTERYGLVVKYAAYFATLVSAALIASTALDTYISYGEDREILAQLQMEKARGAATQIERFIRDIERQIGYSSMPLVDLLASTTEERRVELGKALRQIPAIVEMTLVDGQGRTVAHVARISLDAESESRDWAHDPAFVAARNGNTYFSSIHFNSGTEPYLTIAVAGASRKGACLVAEVNLRYIWEVVSRVEVGNAGYAYVVDSNGRLIAHPDIALVLRRTDLSQVLETRGMKSDVAHAHASFAAGNASVPAGPGNASLKNADVPNTMMASDRLGRAVLTSYAFIPALNWFVVVEQPKAEAMGLLYARLWRAAYLLVAGLVASLLASVLLARHIVRPISTLQQGASEIGHGRLDHRIAVETGDELETLAGDFNRMAARLQESYAELEAKVEARTHELAAANRHKSQFLAAMSHELRTPLNAIIGFSDVLKARMFGELTPKQAKHVEVINASGRHLLALINDILDLSKVEAGKMQLDISRFSVPAAVGDAVTLLRARAADKSIVIDVEVEPSLQPAFADERKFRQIVLNLLSNAIKFTPPHGHVAISAQCRSDDLVVAVGDSGVGIDAADHDAIFQEFVQIGGASRPEGTGLGLALARQFAELHGGSLRVESSLGTGATFTLTLPHAFGARCSVQPQAAAVP